jgi:hypothetical protein
LCLPDSSAIAHSSTVGWHTGAGMDGRSIAPLIIDPTVPGVPAETVSHINAVAPGGTKAYASAWRSEVFIEYYYNVSRISVTRTHAACAVCCRGALLLACRG